MDKRIKTKAQELYPIESHANEHTAFLQGAKLADKTMIDKACRWLEENYYNLYQGTWQEIKEQFINDFRKAMEE